LQILSQVSSSPVPSHTHWLKQSPQPLQSGAEQSVGIGGLPPAPPLALPPEPPKHWLLHATLSPV
jgi:hypothetical protein